VDVVLTAASVAWLTIGGGLLLQRLTRGRRTSPVTIPRPQAVTLVLLQVLSIGLGAATSAVAFQGGSRAFGAAMLVWLALLAVTVADVIGDLLGEP